MKQITIKKTTYDLVQTHAAGLFKFDAGEVEFLGDSVIIDVSDAVHRQLSAHISSQSYSIDKVLVKLISNMDHK